jgi:hypothetical protein
LRKSRKNPSFELFEEIKNGKSIKIQIDGGDMEIEFQLQALEFNDVDPKFIEFVQNELCDYDALKHSNFYIVRE